MMSDEWALGIAKSYDASFLTGWNEGTGGKTTLTWLSFSTPSTKPGFCSMLIFFSKFEESELALKAKNGLSGATKNMITKKILAIKKFFILD